jgi:hypothetical protein
MENSRDTIPSREKRVISRIFWIAALNFQGKNLEGVRRSAEQPNAFASLRGSVFLKSGADTDIKEAGGRRKGARP